jgi:hypothetical protein
MVLEVLRALGSDNFINLATDVRNGLNEILTAIFYKLHYWLTDHNTHVALKLVLEFWWPLIFLCCYKL